MGPIERGPHPLDTAGHPVQLTAYQEAKSNLLERLGRYCAYCEVQQSAALTIDHIEPRLHAPHRELDWENFLLACANCNGTKGAQLLDVYLPDRDNTTRAFHYGEGGLISPHPALGPEQQDKAHRTLKLFGLDKTPASDPRSRDLRWLNRREAWELAQRSLRRWQRKRGDPDIRDSIIDSARAHGHWSIWMSVFEAEPEMRQAFIDAFPGTCRSCFDTATRPVPRPGGSL